MKSFKTFIEERNLGYGIHVLVESLDQPYKLTDVTETLPKHAYDNAEKSGYSDMKLYNCDDEPGHAFFVAKKDGAYEIHHQHLKNGEFLSTKNVMNKVPSKFVSTAFTLIDDKLIQNHPVRVAGTEDHIENYHRLAKLVAKRRGYLVGEKKEYHVDDGFDKPRQSFMIHPAVGKGIANFRLPAHKPDITT